MTDRPPAPPPRRSSVGSDPRHPFAVSPFTRLARTHAAGVGGDALFAIALAGSVFFSLDFNSARTQVGLYLVLTIAPFAVAAPLIGPALDRVRGGRRWMVVGSMAARVVLAFFVIRHLDGIWFYPEAFLMLVFGKVYTISKSALVPTTVRSDAELVQANSKLAVLSAIAVVVVAPFGGAALKLGGPSAVLVLCMLLFVVATVLAFQLPRTTVAAQPEDEAERQELRSGGIILAVSAMGLVRGVVGFLTFMLAFAFKNDDASLLYLGVAAASAQIGYFLGAVVAPRLRQFAREEVIMASCMGAMAVGGVACFLLGGLAGAAVLAFLVGMASSAAKQAFDAVVQRDAPDANRGRSFARFETRFQLCWVIGALIPIVVPIPATVGFLVVAVVAAFAAGSYLLGQSRLKKGRMPVKRRLPRPALLRRRRGATATADGPGADPTTEAPSPPSPSPSPSMTDPTTAAARPSRDRSRTWTRPDLPPPPPAEPPAPRRTGA